MVDINSYSLAQYASLQTDGRIRIIMNIRSHIHQLASQSLEIIKVDYDSKIFKSSKNNQLDLLIQFLASNPTDEEIIQRFKNAMDIEKKSIGCYEKESSIFIKNINEFMLKALFMEYTRLLNHSSKLEICIADYRRKENLQLQQDSSFLYLFVVRMPELLKNLFLFLDVKGLEKLCVTSKVFNQKILKDNLKAIRMKEASPYLTGGMQVFFKTPSGRTITLNVGKKDTIKNIKKTYQKIEGSDISNQRYLWAGRQLDDEKSLGDYKIDKESTIQVIGRLRGD